MGLDLTYFPHLSFLNFFKIEPSVGLSFHNSFVSPVLYQHVFLKVSVTRVFVTCSSSHKLRDKEHLLCWLRPRNPFVVFSTYIKYTDQFLEQSFFSKWLIWDIFAVENINLAWFMSTLACVRVWNDSYVIYNICNCFERFSHKVIKLKDGNLLR